MHTTHLDQDFVIVTLDHLAWERARFNFVRHLAVLAANQALDMGNCVLEVHGDVTRGILAALAVLVCEGNNRTIHPDGGKVRGQSRE